MRGEVRVEAPAWFVGGAVGLVISAFGFVLPFLPPHVPPNAAFGVVLTLIFLLTTIGSLRSRVIVGEDGIVVRFARERFIAFDAIAAIEKEGKGRIRIRLGSGSSEVIALSHRRERKITAKLEAERDELHRRLRSAWQAYRALRNEPCEVAATLGLAGRSGPEWRQAVARAGREPGYREGSIREEDLWRAVEDARVPQDVRAAAAAVLGRALDDDGRARIRVVSDATASPRLRVALDAAALGREEALDEALDAISSELVKHRARR